MSLRTVLMASLTLLTTAPGLANVKALHRFQRAYLYEEPKLCPALSLDRRHSVSIHQKTVGMVLSEALAELSSCYVDLRSLLLVRFSSIEQLYAKAGGAQR